MLKCGLNSPSKVPSLSSLPRLCTRMLRSRANRPRVSLSGFTNTVALRRCLKISDSWIFTVIGRSDVGRLFCRISTAEGRSSGSTKGYMMFKCGGHEPNELSYTLRSASTSDEDWAGTIIANAVFVEESLKFDDVEAIGTKWSHSPSRKGVGKIVLKNIERVVRWRRGNISFSETHCPILNDRLWRLSCI